MRERNESFLWSSNVSTVFRLDDFLRADEKRLNLNAWLQEFQIFYHSTREARTCWPTVRPIAVHKYHDYDQSLTHSRCCCYY